MMEDRRTDSSSSDGYESTVSQDFLESSHPFDSNTSAPTNNLSATNASDKAANRTRLSSPPASQPPSPPTVSLSASGGVAITAPAATPVVPTLACQTKELRETKSKLSEIETKLKACQAELKKCQDKLVDPEYTVQKLQALLGSAANAPRRSKRIKDKDEKEEANRDRTICLELVIPDNNGQNAGLKRLKGKYVQVHEKEDSSTIKEPVFAHEGKEAELFYNDDDKWTLGWRQKGLGSHEEFMRGKVKNGCTSVDIKKNPHHLAWTIQGGKQSKPLEGVELKLLTDSPSSSSSGSSNSVALPANHHSRHHRQADLLTPDNLKVAALPKNWPPEVVYSSVNLWNTPRAEKLRHQSATHGHIASVEIRKLDKKLKKGRFGLFATTDLRKGDTLGSYTGVVYEDCGYNSSEYVAELDPARGICVDAKRVGNEFRFMNDGARDGAKVNVKFTTRSCLCGGGEPMVTVVTTSDIRAGEELLLDY
eukprot:UC1_evm2s2011